MKKHLFILVVFILAIVAGIGKSYGQTCTSGPESPAPGVAYPYSVDITKTNSGAGETFLWYITTETNVLTPTTIISPSAGIFAVNAGVYSNTSGATNSITLTWSAAAVAANVPYYLVFKYTETAPNTGCTVENMKVFRIKPINTFLLAVTGSDLAGATATWTCAAPVSYAVVTDNAATNTATIEYKYGTQTLYYKITASGILGDWRPSVSLPTLTGASLGQVYTSVDWTEDNGTTWVSMTGSGGVYTSTTASATVTDATNGTPIIVRVVIDNQNFETLSNQDIQMGVDGWLPTDFTVSDIKATNDCTPEDPFGKKATMTIQARPTVVATTPGTTPLITKQP